MGAKSKQKGANFERIVCRKLSLWISQNKYSDLFWRSAMSGGRATLALKSGEVAVTGAGDISSVHSLGFVLTEHFSVECKAYKELQFRNLIYDKKSGLPDFWVQTRGDATRQGKKPLLVAKRNNMPAVLCLDGAGVEALAVSEDWLRAYFYRQGMYMMLFDTFLTHVDPNKLLALQPDPLKIL